MNSAFLSSIYGTLDRGHHGWVCSFIANPNSSDAEWSGRAFVGTSAQAALIDNDEKNNYFSPCILHSETAPRRVKSNVAALAVLVADDVNPADINGKPTYLIETSPGKFQCGCKLDPDDPEARDVELLDRIMAEMAAQNLVPADKSGNNIARYVRLPMGANTKPRPGGVFGVKLQQWNPEQVFSVADAASMFGIDVDSLRKITNTPAVQIRDEIGSWSSHLQGFTDPNVSRRSYHDSLLRFTGALRAAGASAGATVNLTRAIMEATRPGADAPAVEVDRWRARLEELPRMAQGADRFSPMCESTPAGSVALRGSHAVLEPSRVVLTMDDLQAASQNIRWLVKGIVPAASMGMLFGASGTFKSFVALDLALHLAHGLPWLGRRTTQTNVLYVALEGGAGVWRRIDAWHRQSRLSTTNSFRVCVQPLLLTAAEQMQTLVASIDAVGFEPRCIVIDTLAQASNVDENDATETSHMLRLFLQELSARFSASVLMIHHSGHAAAERPRGSSALTANIDFALGLFRPDPTAMACQMEVAKMKDGDKPAPIMFDLERHVLGKDEDGDEITSLVARHNDAAAAFVKRMKVGKYEQTLIDYLAATPDPVAEAVLRNVIIAASTSAESGRKNFMRALDSLRRAGDIQQVGPGLWKRKGP